MARSFVESKPGGDYLDSLPWGRSVKLQAERFFDVDKERVLAFMHITAEGEGSGVPVENRTAHEFTVRDGAVVRWKVYADRSEALEAVGLSEQAMSQENVEIVRRLVTMDSGDYDAAVREFSADAKWHNGAFPGPTICSGPAEITAFWKALFEDFEGLRLEIEETIETGETVVVGLHSQGQGKASGAPIDVRWALSFRWGWQDHPSGRLWQLRQALEAVGLSEQDTHADS